MIESSDSMIDTHCHVYSEYYDDIPKVIDEIKKAGITKIIVNGCDMKTNLEVLELVKRYDIVYGALGFHPTELEEYNEECLSWLSKHVNDNKIVAIGEIGLDYHYDNTDKNMQLDVFERQLEIACKFSKPVIVHTRDAVKDTYDMLKKYKLKGSIHCYSGSVEMAREFIKLGYYLGIGGVVTYKNAKNIVSVLEDIPLEYILLETDSPYLSPDGKRGEVNSPINLPIIVDKISSIKNVSSAEVIRVTTKNASDLFDF